MPSQSSTDDSSIPNEDTLWRRIPPVWIVDDKNLGCRRPSSAAFDDHPNGSSMSVGISSVAKDTNRTPQDLLQGHPDFALAGFSAGIARQLNQSIVKRPLIDAPEHGEVVGKKTKKVKRTIAKNSVWIIGPTSTQ